MLGASCLVSCCPPCFVVIARRVCGGGVGAPSQSRPHILDNGPEFVPTAILRWLGDAGIDTALIAPGKPWQNATDESFNGKFRDEFLSLQ